MPETTEAEYARYAAESVLEAQEALWKAAAALRSAEAAVEEASRWLSDARSDARIYGMGFEDILDNGVEQALADAGWTSN
jgi:hypothetical protein